MRRLDKLVDVVQLVERERALHARVATTGQHRPLRHNIYQTSELTSMPFSAHKSTVSWRALCGPSSVPTTRMSRKMRSLKAQSHQHLLSVHPVRGSRGYSHKLEGEAFGWLRDCYDGAMSGSQRHAVVDALLRVR